MSERRTRSFVENLTPEMNAKIEAAITQVRDVLGGIFTDDDQAVIMLGIQFGEMGRDESLPLCALITNVRPCVAEGVLADMHEQAGLIHKEFHEGFGLNPEDFVREIVGPDAVPAEVRKDAEAYAERLGLPVDRIEYVVHAPINDLNEAEGPEALGE